jgi:tetratricopeptide (TPR) repeat protein
MRTTCTFKPVLVALATAMYVAMVEAEASPIRLAQVASVQGCVGDGASQQQRIENCTRLINEVPMEQRGKAYLARGNAYLDGGGLEKAIADYDKSLELQPRDKEALYERGFALHDKGDFDRAIADYTAAIDIDGHD